MLSARCYPGPVCRGSSFSKEDKTLLSPGHFHQLFLENPAALLSQPRHIISPVCPGLPLPPPRRTCLKHLLKEVSRVHPGNLVPDAQTSSSGSYQCSGSTLTPYQTAVLLTLSLRMSPATLRRKPISHLYS